MSYNEPTSAPELPPFQHEPDSRSSRTRSTRRSRAQRRPAHPTRTPVPHPSIPPRALLRQPFRHAQSPRRSVRAPAKEGRERVVPSPIRRTKVRASCGRGCGGTWSKGGRGALEAGRGRAGGRLGGGEGVESRAAVRRVSFCSWWAGLGARVGLLRQVEPEEVVHGAQSS